MRVNTDSKLWVEAYDSYKKQQKSYRKLKPRNQRTKFYTTKHLWVEKTKEYYRWKKTDNYQEWRKRQFALQSGLCYYCDIDLKDTKTNVEHIIPRSRGGTNHKNNLVLACWECNQGKSNRELTLYEKSELRERHESKYLAYLDEIRIGFELRELFKYD